MLKIFSILIGVTDLNKARPFNAATGKSVHKALKDIKEGKNVSSRFISAKEAIAYLKI